MESWSVPGLSIAVIRDGRLLRSAGYGYAEIGHGEKIDVDTIFGIGSLTKSFTIAATATLVQEGKIEWDAPIAEYLDWFQYGDPWLTKHASVRDLAAHRVGVDANFAWLHGDWGVDATLRKVRYLPVNKQYGQFFYSNTGIATLGKVIEAVSAQTWESYVRSRLLAPLEMSRTAMDKTGYIKPESLATCWTCTPPAGADADVGLAAVMPGKKNVAVPHGPREQGDVLPGKPREVEVWQWRHERSIAPAGSIVSSANDMSKWLLFHLGSSLTPSVLGREQLDELHRYQVLDSQSGYKADSPEYHYWKDVELLGYGLGWRKALYRGHKVSFHNGGQVGFGATMWLVPERSLGVVVMMNLDFRAALAHEVIARYVVDALLDLPPIDWNQRAIAVWNKSNATSDLPKPEVSPCFEHDLEDYQGTYVNEVMGRAVLEVDNGHPSIMFGATSIGDLEHIQHQHFKLTFRGSDRWQADVGIWHEITDDSFRFAIIDERDRRFRYEFKKAVD
jgi:CubicO group peptidase (beta-lactamase class C family)